METYSKKTFSYSERNINQHHTSYMLLCILSLLQAFHISSGNLDSFYAHCTHQITVRSVACNKLKVSEGSNDDVIRSVTEQCCSVIQND